MASLRKASDKWVLDYSLHGYRRRVSYETKKEAEDALESVSHSLLSRKLQVNGMSVNSHVSLLFACEEFINTREEKITFKNEVTYMERFLGFMCETHYQVNYLREISTEHILHYRAWRMESVSPSTMQREGGILRVFFNFCLRKKWLSENPMVGLSKLRHTPTPRTLWTESQIRLMHKSLPDWGKDIFAFIALTGVRPVEACKLRFCDVKGQAVRVHCWKNQKDGSRWIGLSDEAHAIISRRMESMKDHDDPIFTNHEGKRLLPDHLNKTFTRTREKLGFPEALQLYALRHTFASRLCENNVNLKIVQDLLGHSQIRTTERYLQIRTEKLTEAANKIRGIFTQ